jgi:Domain of unknown function (DUF5600)
MYISCLYDLAIHPTKEFCLHHYFKSTASDIALTSLSLSLSPLHCTQLIDNLPAVFRTVMKKYNLAPGDFPDIRDFQDKLSEMDFTKFHSLKQKLVDDIEGVLANDIPRLMAGEQTSSSRLPRTPCALHL